MFISIEGVEGVGKSTAIHFLKEKLTDKNIASCFTREPGGTVIAEAIRDVLLQKYSEPMHDDTELLLMFASRAQHIAQVIKPQLAAGVWVVSDRFVDASFAYQGGGRGLSQTRIAELAAWTLGDLLPDVTILLDAPVEVALQRCQQRGPSDRIEEEGADFFARIRDTYMERAKNDPERFVIVDASGSIDAVKQQLSGLIETITHEHR